MKALNNHHFYFYIAKDEQGVKDLAYGETFKEHILKIPIERQDIDNSWDLIFTLNEKLSLMIDIYEDEQIELDKLPKALKITESILENEQDPNTKASISKFVSVIKMAIQYNSPLLFWW